MKKPSRLFRVIGVAGLLISLLAATVAPVAAQDDDDLSQDWLDALIIEGGAGFLAGTNAIYYPWVANGEDFGLGSSQTSVTVQNLEDTDTTISIYVGNGSGGFTLATSAYLAPYASKTFSAGQLGIAAGSGAPVQVISFNEDTITSFPTPTGVPAEALTGLPAGTIALVETPVTLSNPITADPDGGTTTQVIVCVVNVHTATQPNLGQPWGYVNAQTGEWVSYSTQQELQDTLNAANGDDPDELINPFGGLNNDGDCFDALDAVSRTVNNGVAIAGTALQTATAGSDDDNGAETQQAAGHTSTSGYNAINGVELGRFHQWYLPIVQTNGGPGGKWNSIIRVGNLEAVNNAVTLRFFPADDASGSLHTGFQVQELINGGATLHVDLSTLVPADWVGSVHIYSDGSVFAMVDRYKVGTGMWLTNTGSGADFENVAQVPGANGRYALFAPHVLLDYFGWNTGINVANLYDGENHVSIQYFNLLGNATEVLNRRLAAHGMTYFYDPSDAAQDNNSQDVTTDPNAGVVGSAIIWSDHPVAAVVDGVKYAETDPNGGADVGNATSYNATANVFPWQAVPYVTKGNPNGTGATSGINILNPNSVVAIANVTWFNPSGFAGSNFGTSSVTIPAFANGFVYTLWQHNLPNGFMGSAQVVSNVPVAAVSANVNYDVADDGAVIFNAVNPCGLYRVGGGCSFGDVLEPGGQSVTKTFIDEAGEPVPGVNFTIASTSGALFSATGVTGPDGSRTFTNVPVGVYELTVNAVPGDYVLPVGVQDTFVVEEGEDVMLTNTLGWAQGFSKLVCVPDEFDEDSYFEAWLEWAEGGMVGPEPHPLDFFPCTDEVLQGVNVVVYENTGTDPLDGPVAGEIVFEGVTGADGMVGAGLAPGTYILCVYADPDGTITTSNGEEIETDLPPAVDMLVCLSELRFGEVFTVETGQLTVLENFAFIPQWIG